MKIEWKFTEGRDGFAYQDDTFRFTSNPAYASGAYASSGGYTGGGLRVSLGGRDEADIFGMSGGWSKTFALTQPENVTLSFRYNLTQSRDYEANEFSDVLASIDGQLFGTGGRDYVARVSGDGNGGSSRSTGWQIVTIDLGKLEPGQHTVKLGGYNNQKTTASESTTVRFDDVAVVSTPANSAPTPTEPSLTAFEDRVFELTNEFRVQNGQRPLENDARLNAAAEDWSQEMADGDFFRHSNTGALIEEHGYDWRAWGENIAAGQRTPESVVNAWINSPGHRANMLDTDFEDIGIGHVYLANDSGNVNYQHYWTQIFASEML